MSLASTHTRQGAKSFGETLFYPFTSKQDNVNATILELLSLISIIYRLYDLEKNACHLMYTARFQETFDALAIYFNSFISDQAQDQVLRLCLLEFQKLLQEFGIAHMFVYRKPHFHCHSTSESLSTSHSIILLVH